MRWAGAPRSSDRHEEGGRPRACRPPFECCRRRCAACCCPLSPPCARAPPISSNPNRPHTSIFLPLSLPPIYTAPSSFSDTWYADGTIERLPQFCPPAAPLPGSSLSSPRPLSIFSLPLSFALLVRVSLASLLLSLCLSPRMCCLLLLPLPLRCLSPPLLARYRLLDPLSVVVSLPPPPLLLPTYPIPPTLYALPAPPPPVSLGLTRWRRRWRWPSTAPGPVLFSSFGLSFCCAARYSFSLL